MKIGKALSAVAILMILLAGCGKVEKKEIRIHFTGFSRTFNDLNDKHLASAKKYGVERVTSREDARRKRRYLSQIEDCRYYKIEDLTHSVPYLVPKAKDLLERIGRNFADSLHSKGVDSYRIVVTSILRTDEDVKKLRRKNINASENSAHRYGTTMDVAYAKFDRINDRYPYDIPSAQLKLVLAEVLRDLREQKQCYVRYEVKQGCFHITVR